MGSVCVTNDSANGNFICFSPNEEKEENVIQQASCSKHNTLTAPETNVTDSVGFET